MGRHLGHYHMEIFGVREAKAYLKKILEVASLGNSKTNSYWSSSESNPSRVTNRSQLLELRQDGYFLWKLKSNSTQINYAKLIVR